METTKEKHNTPNIHKRHAHERGRAEHGWLHAKFTFSFAEYFDPDYMGFRFLRVMNNDTIEPQGGFATHPHENAEIFTYVISGELQHQDSMGNGSVITPGNLQYMSAGSGVRHSEFNPSKDTQTELYQIWLQPNQSGGEPVYEEKKLGDAAKDNALTLLFSGIPKEGATLIRQNAEIYFGKVSAGNSLNVDANKSFPYAWVQVIFGEIRLLGETLSKADGLAISDQPSGYEIQASSDTQLLFFRLS